MLEESSEPGGHAVSAKVRHHPLASPLTHRGAGVGAAAESAKAICERGRLTRRHEVAGHPVDDELTGAPGIGRYDGLRTRHGLHRSVGESLMHHIADLQ